MTTTVKVTTHDWPVAVTMKDELAGFKPAFNTVHVEPRSEREFYLTNLRSLKFEELPKSENVAGATGSTDYAWLIEALGNRAAPIYWDGADWSADHLRAVRFRRKVDAERVMINLVEAHRQPHMAAVEHGWHSISTDPAAEPQAAPTTAVAEPGEIIPVGSAAI